MLTSPLSVLFSEPKIPQFPKHCLFPHRRTRLSVLFSEPKIPQYQSATLRPFTTTPFSALQRAENSSIEARDARRGAAVYFQCSSASRKFLNSSFRTAAARVVILSVLFSEPKIPQSG